MKLPGQKALILLHHLLRRFEWRIDADYVAPLDYHSLPFPADGLPVRLRPYSAPHQARTPA